jgi:hypothetical protein
MGHIALGPPDAPRPPPDDHQRSPEGRSMKNTAYYQAMVHNVVLSLSYTKITDLTPLSGLTALKELNLSYTDVTDLTPVRDIRGLKIYGKGKP